MFREFVAAKRRQRTQLHMDRWIAWHTAAWSRLDKQLPEYAKAVNRPDAKHASVMKAQEQMAVWRSIGDIFGKQRRKHNPRRVRIIRG